MGVNVKNDGDNQVYRLTVFDSDDRAHTEQCVEIPYGEMHKVMLALTGVWHLSDPKAFSHFYRNTELGKLGRP